MNRSHFQQAIDDCFNITPAVALIGPRQCGKTTLTRDYMEAQGLHTIGNYFDLESPSGLSRLNNPELVLSRLHGLIVIDEVQRKPELFSLLRTLIDDPYLNQQYLLLGSASGELLRQSSESLAGRITYLELPPFTLQETKNWEQLWLRGGFPRAYLAKNDRISSQWCSGYIRTFLEQDIPNLGIQIPANQLRRFWMMLAHYHGCILNASELGRNLNLTHNTIRRYIDILTQTFMVRSLSPWHANIKKRQVKAPKIYLRDSGILHALLSIENTEQLYTHPSVGHSWEGFAIEELIRYHECDAQDCYYWATHAHAELDLLLIKDNRKLGFEIKFTEMPKLTKSMKIAQQDLSLDQLTVVFPGNYRFPLSDTIEAVGIECFYDTA